MRRTAHAPNTKFASAQLGRIPLTALRHAVVVSEVLNFRHAASILGVAQSSVSARIKLLEETLGVLLFERRHRGVRLTEAGRRFIGEVSVGIAHLDHAVRTAGAISASEEGRLAVGLHASIASGFLADLRTQFRSRYPKIEQTIMEGRSSETIALVRDGCLDVAFVVGPVDAPDCHSRELWQETLVVALSAAHPLIQLPSITWTDIAAETFLVREGGSGPQVFEHIVRRVSEHERTPYVHHLNIGRDTLMHMVASGEGITLTSEAVAHIPFPGVTFVRIADEREKARFSAVWSPHNRNPALMSFLDLATTTNRSTQSD